MAIQGHKTVVDSLHTFLPGASLFVGPYSVGRWTVAEHLRWYYNVDNEDTLRIHWLTTDTAESIAEFVRTPARSSQFKFVIVDLYKASLSGESRLAGVLDDAATFKNARIIILSVPSYAPPSIRSRTTPYVFRPLSEAEVVEVLVQKMNFSRERAEALAPASGGQVAHALRLADADDELEKVRNALAAIRNHDADALNECAKDWTDETTAWLLQWCHEDLTCRWEAFTPSDFIAGRRTPLAILMALQERVRPRLVVRSQLMDLLKG